MKKISDVLLATVASAVITFVVIFGYGPTELFPDTQLTFTETAFASLKASALIGGLVFVLLGGTAMAAWANTLGPKHSMRLWKD